MATITNTTTDANGNIIVDVSSSEDDSITLATAGNYSDKNIIFNLAVQTEAKEPMLQGKTVTYTSNGTATITPDDGYDGLSSVDVTVDVASGGGGGTGFKVTFPATATNWKSGNRSSTSAYLWLSDGTMISMVDRNYSNVAGKTFDGVIGLYVKNSNASYVPRITLMGSVIVNGISGSSFGITTDGVTPARFSMPNELIFLFISDATISSIEIYNTD